MKQIKVKIPPFRCWWKSTIAAVKEKKNRATTAASWDDEEDDAGAPIVLKMDLHCAACAGKIKRAVMDVPGVEKVATDEAASLVRVTGTADAAVVATSVQVRTRKFVTIVSDGTS